MPAENRLTARERRLVRLVTEGRPDAEIAVRLGTSVAAVRREIAALIAARGLSGREALADLSVDDSPPHTESEPRTARVTRGYLLAAAGVVSVALLLIFAVTRDSGETRVPATSVVATASPSPTAMARAVATSTADPPATVLPPKPLPLEQHGDFREYTQEELSAAGFVDTGTFIVIPLNRLPAARSSFRAGFTAIEATEAGYLNLGAERWHRGFRPGSGFSSTQAVGLTTMVAGVPVYAIFSAESGLATGTRTRLLPAGDGEVAFYATDDGAPAMILAVEDADRRPVPAVVDALGHLWVRPAPVANGPTSNDTGEQLRVAGATVFGPLDPPRFSTNWTFCGELPACVAVMHYQTEGGLTALEDGQATCVAADRTVIEVDLAEFTVRYEEIPFGDNRAEDCVGSFPREVLAGERLSEVGSWQVSASAADGTPLHVAEGDGPTLYIGVEREIEVCPPCLVVGT